MPEDPMQVSMAHFAVSKSRPLITSGVGSCMVIVLYDPQAKIGGLAHTMLPDEKFEGKDGVPQKIDAAILVGSAKTVGHAVDMVLDGIESLGGNRSRCIAKVAGGAHMFSLFDAPKTGIGQQNIEAIRKKFEQIKIPIVAEDTGGTIGRVVEFDVQSGVMNVTTKI